MKEREFTKEVLKFAREHGWLAAHFGNTVRIVRRDDGYHTIPDLDAQGFPDCVFLKAGRLIFAELKSATGRVTPSQKVWLEALAGAEVESYVWKVSDWPEAQGVLAS